MTGAGGLSFDRYSTAGSSEWMMRIGNAEAPPILFLPPLLEELNRTRALLSGLMRRLAARGLGCWLPDLPGTGESERALEHCRWEDWLRAVEDAADHIARASAQAPLIASMRGGALLDGLAPSWRFAPAEGASLARDLARASMLKPEDLTAPSIDAAGYRLPQALFAALQAAKLPNAGQVRTLRLASDPADADLKVEGAALWRRSEPSTSPELADLLTADLADWHASCAA